MPENESNIDEQERLLALLSERTACLERIQRLQHAEIGKLYAGVRALQDAFDRMVAQASAAPVN